MSQGIHSCSWFCELPNCVKAQRDELRERVAELQDNGNRLFAVADSAAAHQRDMIEAACAPLHERIAILERDGPQMQRGRNLDGTIWMGSMRECLADARSCADAEARVADQVIDELNLLRAELAELHESLGTPRPQPQPAIPGPAVARS